MAIPVSLEDAARHLRYEDGEELPPGREADIMSFIADAAAWVERYTGHILIERDVVEPFYGPDPARLRAWPIKQGATATIGYTADDGSEVTLPPRRIDILSRPARFNPPRGVTPFAGPARPYTVTVTAGYANGDEVPGNFRRAMLVLIAAYDADREGGDLFKKAEATARSLCADYRVRRV